MLLGQSDYSSHRSTRRDSATHQVLSFHVPSIRVLENSSHRPTLVSPFPLLAITPSSRCLRTRVTVHLQYLTHKFLSAARCSRPTQLAHLTGLPDRSHRLVDRWRSILEPSRRQTQTPRDAHIKKASRSSFLSYRLFTMDYEHIPRDGPRPFHCIL